MPATRDGGIGSIQALPGFTPSYDRENAVNNQGIRVLRGSLSLLLAWALVCLPVWHSVSLAQSLAEEVKPRIAVLEFSGIGVSPAEVAAITDQMRTDLVNLRKFVMLDRTQTEKVIDELAFQQEGLTDSNQAAKIGKILNVEFIVTGRVTSLDGAYQVNSQMISVETGEIVRSASILYQGNILGLLSQNIATIAARLSQVEPPPVSSTMIASQPEPEEEGWLPWWAWALIAVGVIGALAGGGDESDGGGGSSLCPSSSGCGTVGVSW